MRAYASNILPTDAAYYSLSNATIVNGQLNLQTGGSATINIEASQLPALTEYFKVAAIMPTYSDGYVGSAFLAFQAVSSSGQHITHLCNLSSDAGVPVGIELEAIAEGYTSLQVTIFALTPCILLSWELCPEMGEGDIQVIIDGVTQSLPKLLYDFNTWPVRVESYEQVVGMISCYLHGNTDLQGHFTMNCTASDYCTVHLRFLDNNMVELFSPMLFTISPGITTLTVPHAYLKKLAGAHNFYVTAQVTNGYLDVPIRGILYTIDGGYLASRLMDPGMDLEDIAIEQLPTDISPSRIWGIGIDNEEVIVKRRSYDLSAYNEAWEGIYTLGHGSHAAIEFDGDWVRREGSPSYTIETHDVPIIAVVTLDGQLKVYNRGTVEDPIDVDTNVTDISLVRGFKSSEFVENDQGVVLAYIKNGDVWYRQYVYFDGAYTWITAVQLTTSGDIQHVQVHRLNDYRIGIVTQGATENIWYISDRTYVRQAIEPELTSAFLDGPLVCTVARIGDDGHNPRAVQNNLLDATTPQNTFELTWEDAVGLRLYGSATLETWKFSIQVESSDGSHTIKTVTIEGNKLTIVTEVPVELNRIVSITWNPVLTMVTSNGALCPIDNHYSWGVGGNACSSEVGCTISGTLVVLCQGPNDMNVSQPDPVQVNITGDLLVTPLLVTFLEGGSTEEVTSSVEGDLTVQLIQTGDVPI